MTKKSSSANKKISMDAQKAWDEGKSFYAPSFVDFAGKGVEQIFESADEPSRMAQRHVDWESALEGISAVGWQLNTWSVQRTVSEGQLKISSDRAFALFVRS
ncbi:hypothetical protein [Cryobacterium sp. Y50]|uniref:hypothetical protein n=1 Tax=Cryobacterium sp. Y50 TaxID=2048286 RepID=UPI000CE341A6|nr:hypothetical protein [Cryobacterium sp. Y50]